MPETELVDFDTLWDYNRPAETEARFRALLEAGRHDRSYYTQLLTQIARAQGLQRKFAEAQNTLDEVESLLTGELVRSKIRYELERGRLLNSSGQPEAAHPFFARAFELASRTPGEDFYAVDAAHMLAIVEQGEAELDWNLRALALAEKSAEPRARDWLGSLYNNIGWSYHDRGEFEIALQYLQRALAWRIEQGRAQEIRIARWCVARGLRSLERYPEALAIQQQLLADHQAAGEVSGYVYEELGECLLAFEQPDEARRYFALAHAELSQDAWLQAEEPDRLARLKALSQS